MSSLDFAQPDYAQIINGMPEVIDFYGSAAERRAKAAAARAAALRSLVVRYGGLGSVQDKYGDIDAATRDAATNNQFSDMARLNRSYDQSVEGVKRNLAARRMLQSGELQHGLDQVDIAKGTSEYDLGQRFMNAASGIFGGYSDVEGALAQEEAGVINSSAQRAGINYSVPVPQQAAPAPAPTPGMSGNSTVYSHQDQVPLPAITGPTTTAQSGDPAYYRVVDGALRGLGYA